MSLVEHSQPRGCGCDTQDLAGGLPGLDAALELLLRLVPPPGAAEVLPLAQAGGRVLARTLRARGLTPPFDNAAMDGYALRSADLTGAGPWRLPVAGRITAGDGQSHVLEPGTVRQIFTGARLPEGADAVVMQEDVIPDREGGAGMITLRHPTGPGTHIRRAGEDLRPGDMVLPAGSPLGPRQIAALAAAGCAAVAVTAQLRVALLATGDELRAPGTVLPAAGIWDVNTPMLLAALAGPRLRIVACETAADSRAGLRAQLAALAGQADLIVTTGGISVGAADHVKPALLAAGGVIALSGVALKPGKPVSAGRLGAAVWLGLPGNPLSAFVAWHLLGRPLLAAMCGQGGAASPARGYVLSDTALTHRLGRCEARLAHVIGTDGLGRRLVRAAPATHSGRVAALPQADGLILLPAATGHLPAGSLLDFFPFTDH
jgi:molybdopterin molybdotransferase